MLHIPRFATHIWTVWLREMAKEGGSRRKTEYDFTPWQSVGAGGCREGQVLCEEVVVPDVYLSRSSKMVREKQPRERTSAEHFLNPSGACRSACRREPRFKHFASREGSSS